jgi:hypothetical protein
MLLLLGCTIQLEATKRALIIGIGTYPEESGWNVISGDKDIAIVEKTLLANGFKQDDIAVLANNQATHNAIVHSIETLVQSSQKGDIVYIHFSGHGQLITDTNGDEPNCFDESWIPYDARKEYTKGIYEGENHLVDDQLNAMLHQLRIKVGQTGKIIVIADACHSGGGSRDEDEDNIRGTGNAFVLPQKAEFKAQNRAEDWIFISACKAYQFNQQCKDTKYGSLTYAIYLNRDKYSQTAAEFVRAISDSIASLVKYSQTPQLDCPAKMLDEIVLP